MRDADLRFIAFLAVFVGIATTAIACDPAEGVTWVNQTDRTVLVYSGDQLDDTETTLPPHSSKELATADFLWDDVVVLRDEQGNVLFRQELTWDQFKAQGFRFVITEDMLSPPSPTPAPSPATTLPPEQHLGVGDSETHGNVTVTLVEASFSSSRSQLVFDLEDRSPLAGESSQLNLVMPDVAYSGFASEGYPMVAVTPTGPHTTRNTVTLGPIEAPDGTVVFDIGIVWVEREQGGEDVEGPWHFEFIPG